MHRAHRIEVTAIWTRMFAIATNYLGYCGVHQRAELLVPDDP